MTPFDVICSWRTIGGMFDARAFHQLYCKAQIFCIQPFHRQDASLMMYCEMYVVVRE
jgi:hypothetical protein